MEILILQCWFALVLLIFVMSRRNPKKMNIWYIVNGQEMKQLRIRKKVKIAQT